MRKNYNKSPLEMEADKLLSDILKSKKKNKSKISEYPILSDTQISRRSRREIPFSNLSTKQRINARLKGAEITDPETES